MTSKIRATHLERRAVVYLRQSSPKQVRDHRESTTRQYALRDRALALGWSAENVDTIDDDLGQSGTSAEWREGFQRLAEDVAQGRVGAILALEVSRLARSSADWHRLLDLAGLADVILADEDTVYDPREPNDRMLLGLKGQFAAAEQYWMRLRLQGGRLNKARRGELVFPAPTGYVWGDDGHLRFDPDEEVQRSIRLLFERVLLDGSARAAVRYFARNGLKMPRRDPYTGELAWTPPRYQWAIGILHNPLFAGAYVFGRREERTALVDGEIRRRRLRNLPQEEWAVFLRDQHPAYISWERHLEIQTRLRQNRQLRHREAPDGKGAAREGAALLQGLTLCGRCGHRMYARYSSRDRSAVYQCRGAEMKDATVGRCWAVPATRIDEAVTRAFLSVMKPPEVELSLAVVRDAERQGAEIQRQWRLRLDGAQYEARLCERRYKSVDPDNRTVARTLEREWNEKLEALARLEREYEEVRRREKVEFSVEDRQDVLALVRDLPRVWDAPTTTNAERKNLLRMVVQQVTLSPIDVPERLTRVQILWVTGATTETTVRRPRPHEASRTPASALAALKKLCATGVNDGEVAEELNRQGLVTGRGERWNTTRVRYVRASNGMPAYRGPKPGRGRVAQRDDGLYSTFGVAQLVGVTIPIVHSWMAKGWLKPVDPCRHRPAWFRLDEAEIERLQGLRESLIARGYGPGGRQPKERPEDDTSGKEPAERRTDGLYSTHGVAKLLDVTVRMVRTWYTTGILEPAEGGRWQKRWFRLDGADIERLQAYRSELFLRGYGPGGRHASSDVKEDMHCV